jgi:Lrp/AsnC family leucine-responsive transcriptional regulator
MSTVKNKAKILDRIDLAILHALQENGRISNVELANRINLSASPCLDRVKRLEQDGYIVRYGAVLNANMLNYGMSAFVQVTLDRTTADVFENFKQAVVNIKEVAECHLVAGGYDYLLKIRFKDMQNYREILEKVVSIPAISQTHTYMITEHIKEDSGVPIF